MQQYGIAQQIRAIACYKRCVLKLVGPGAHQTTTIDMSRKLRACRIAALRYQHTLIPANLAPQAHAGVNPASQELPDYTKRMLAMLEPTMLLSEMPGNPCKLALTDVNSSGSDVPNAAIVAPMKFGPKIGSAGNCHSSIDSQASTQYKQITAGHNRYCSSVGEVYVEDAGWF